MQENDITRQALSELQTLKNTVRRTPVRSAVSTDSIDTHLLLNIAAFAVAASISAGVFIWPVDDDVRMLRSVGSERLPILGLIGGGLLGLLGLAYGTIGLQARKEKIALQDFMEKHFFYFRNLAALSDIFVKFCVTVLLVMTGQTAWIAPLFILFIGDLAFQGRLLTLPPSLSITAGLASFSLAIVAFSTGITSLFAPAVLAMVLTAASVATILNHRRRILTIAE